MTPRGIGIAALVSVMWSLSIVFAVETSPVEIATPREHRRGVEQTFLTFPEWFLVFSPAEYADFVGTHTPDDFPFWGHIRQFWESYAAVAGETRRRNDPPNAEYHVMINVIGVSTTVEYAGRSAYERFVGRFTALTQDSRGTPEDALATRFAQEYVDFIRVRPWYEFDFASRLAEIWRAPGVGPNLLRKWERRYALTTEYGIKAVYGWLLEKATHSTFDAPVPVTAVVASRGERCGLWRAATPVRNVSDHATLWLLPRYAPFTAAAVEAARCDTVFEEIAGNRSVILVSALAPGSAAAVPNATVLLTQPILTRPELLRRLYVAPVSALSGVLREIETTGGTVEHVFDY